MSVALFLDAIIALLLVMTIAWCVALNRRLGGLRRNQKELTELIGSLNEATTRAEAGIAALKANAEKAGASLRTSIDQAEKLNDDLNFLAERSAKLARRLEGAGPSKGPGPVSPGDQGLGGPGSPARQKLEKELLNALRAAR